MGRQSKYSKRRVPGGKTHGRYHENLQTVGNRIYSYGTHVATYISGTRAGRNYPLSPGKVETHGWWSPTTSKHINYIARKWGVTVRKGK